MFRNLFRKEVEFNQVPQEDCESLGSNPSASENFGGSQQTTLSIRQAIGLFFATAIISGISGAWIGSLFIGNDDQFTVKKISKYCRFGCARTPRMPLPPDI